MKKFISLMALIVSALLTVPSVYASKCSDEISKSRQTRIQEMREEVHSRGREITLEEVAEVYRVKPGAKQSFFQQVQRQRANGIEWADLPTVSFMGDTLNVKAFDWNNPGVFMNLTYPFILERE